MDNDSGTGAMDNDNGCDMRSACATGAISTVPSSIFSVLGGGVEDIFVCV